MKHVSKQKSILGTLVAAMLGMTGLGLTAPLAHADIVPGYYEGRFPSYKFKAEVYVYKTGDASGTGIIIGTIKKGTAINDPDTGTMRTEREDTHFGAVYQIVETDTGLQAWTQLFRNGEGSLSMPEGLPATFEARTHVTTKGIDRTRLDFNPTDFGRSIKCGESFSVKLTRHWYPIAFPTKDMDFKGTDGVSSGFLETVHHGNARFAYSTARS